MTLLITALAAVVVTVIWYTSEKARKLNISLLMYTYTGAALMWLVDSVTEYMETGVKYFTPDTNSMINDGFLGLSAVILGLIIWIVALLIKDPLKVITKKED